MSRLKSVLLPLFLLFWLLLMALPAPAVDAPDWMVRDLALTAYNEQSGFCVSLAAREHLEIALDTAHSVEVMVRLLAGTRVTMPVRRIVQGKALFSVPARPAGEYCLALTHLERQAGRFTVQVRYRRVASASEK